VDVRQGTIQRVEDVAASKKLVKLTVSFGAHTTATATRSQRVSSLRR